MKLNHHAIIRPYGLIIFSIFIGLIAGFVWSLLLDEVMEELTMFSACLVAIIVATIVYCGIQKKQQKEWDEIIEQLDSGNE